MAKIQCPECGGKRFRNEFSQFFAIKLDRGKPVVSIQPHTGYPFIDQENSHFGCAEVLLCDDCNALFWHNYLDPSLVTSPTSACVGLDSVMDLFSGRNFETLKIDFETAAGKMKAEIASAPADYACPRCEAQDDVIVEALLDQTVEVDDDGTIVQYETHPISTHFVLCNRCFQKALRT